MMRRPLDRRMFTTPQQRRGMARMPQGILASGPRIMNAAMPQQEPVRMQEGGLNANEPKFGDGLVDFITGLFTSSSAPGVGDTSGTGNSRRRRNRPAPNAVPSVVAAEPPAGSEVPAQNSPKGGPPIIGAEDNTEVVGGVNYDTVSQFPPKTDASVDISVLPPESDSPTTLMQALDALRNRRGGKDKDTKKYVEEANALLKEFGIDAPDLKGRKDLRIMEFFLNMAAGQSPDFLTNVGQAGKEAFKGYGEDVREIEAAEQKLKLAGLEMGLAEKARAEATEQAILLKEYDITTDVFEKINDLPDKSQQVKVLMETYNVPQEDALKMVYPERTVTPQGYELRLKGYVDAGHSPTVAHYLASGGATLLQSLADGNPIGEQIAGVAVAGGQPLTVADARILGVQTTSVGN